MRKVFISLVSVLMLLACGPKDGQHEIYVVSTGDVHGSFFAAPYVDGQKSRTSLMSVKYYVDSLRAAKGAENVVFIDDGDILQGDNAAYYYNYVATDRKHIFPKFASYMGYDALVVGNHDIETGHAVYDRVNAELKKEGLVWLGGNAVKPNGKPYFPVYTILKKGGLKIAVLGFDNANIKAWLSEELWSGMTFESLIPLVQSQVDAVIAKEKPQVVIVGVHSGSGVGDGSQLESQGLDLLYSLKGVDVLITGHDHRPLAVQNGNACMINGGARAGAVGYAEVTVDINKGKVLSKNAKGSVVRMNKNLVDENMVAKFSEEFEAVKAFTMQPVGNLAMDLKTRDAYTGMCDYVNLVHTVQLQAKEAQLSFAAPLTFNGSVKAGQLIFNDMFTVYPFENQLFVLKLSGSEIRNYLEMSYSTWIQTPGEHVLLIQPKDDERTSSRSWSFVGRSYNFDSCAGLIYDVDVTRPFGERVMIKSLADGSAFDENVEYAVAMTSYRASGGGELLQKGAGIPAEDLDGRVIARYPEIRTMIHDYFVEKGTINPEDVNNPSVIGSWRFIPEDTVAPLMAADMDLLF